MSEIDFKPLGNKFLVKAVETEVSSGGIIIPGQVEDISMEGTVLAVGSGEIQEDGSIEPLNVSVGDQLVFAGRGGLKMYLEDTEYLLMDETNVIGIVR